MQTVFFFCNAIKSLNNMANEIKIFDNPQFGEIRTAGTSEKPLFCLADVCRVLDLQVTPTKNRLKPDGVSLIKVIDSLGREQEATFITEQNLYKVIMRSDKPQAEPFQDWVCGEVLPSIRKTGSYLTEKLLSPSELILKLAQMNVENERKMKALEEKQTRLESEIEEIKQRTTTDLHQSTIVAYVSRNNIKLDVKRYGAMGRKASTLCKKRNIAVTKINDVRWGKVNVFPDDILDEVFGMKGGLTYEN